MKKLSSLLMVALFVFVVAACGAKTTSEKPKAKEEPATETASEETTEGAEAKSEEITITHQLGETTFMTNPEKVVVFDFGILDSLDKLGVNVTGLPQENIPDYLSKYEGDEYISVGSLKEIDYEKLSEVAPDLIIISGRQGDFYKELSEIAPTIFMGVDTTKYMESFEENMNTLGKIFNKQEEVKTEIAAIKETISSVGEAAADKKALVVLLNDGSVSAYGSGSRFGIIHDVMGVPAADENIEASTHGQKVTFEYIVEKDPDYLFVVDRTAVVGGETSAEEALENELIQGTKAYKNDHIVYLDPAIWYLSGGGLVSVSEMAKEIETGLQ
ncbi:siderophore ABC transporter substrate-binding protein [Metabacillus litoralis]|uniref:siderophore ABC transporter substrate-binding protein n=1 Tax=Metabacillus litoralis TaxID=152268 RepID=UPI001CFCD064|nr:siderophore ABC transporter substrate-binding protein [Metabacillus litoralis]